LGVLSSTDLPDCPPGSLVRVAGIAVVHQAPPLASWLLATLIRCDSGRITWNGLNYISQTHMLREHIGYVPQHVELPRNLTPRW
jgi:hypothetical protein